MIATGSIGINFDYPYPLLLRYYQNPHDFIDLVDIVNANMASSKAKKGLGDMFRHAMRHHKKSLDGSHETVSLSSVLEFGQGTSMSLVVYKPKSKLGVE